MPVVSTNLKCGASKMGESLYKWVRLAGVNFLLILCGSGTTDLCDDSAIYNLPIYGLLYRFVHQWEVFIKQSFEFTERRA